MEHQLDCVITKVYEAKKGDGTLVEGKGDYGKWKLYTFYTDNTGDKKFGFMWDEKKPLPIEGLHIKHMEYEVKVEGKYTNYSVKKMELAEEKSTPQAGKENMGSIPIAHSEPAIDRNVSMYVSYMKDIAVAILNGGGDLNLTDFDKYARAIGKAGLIMMNESLNNGPISSQEPKTGPPIDYGVVTAPPIGYTEKEKINNGIKIHCPKHEKEILRIACKQCSEREGCPSHVP